MAPPGARLSSADVHLGRPEGSQAQTPEGSVPTHGPLTGRPRLDRLRRKADIGRVLRRGRVGRAGPVTVRALVNETGQVRLALSVSRKVGRAVVRNRVRRRIREAVRAELAAMARGTDLWVSVAPQGAGMSFAELRAWLREALRRAGVWGGSPSP